MSLLLIFKTYLGTLNGIHNHTAWTVFHWSCCYRANLSPVQHSDRKFHYLPTYSLISSEAYMGLTCKRKGGLVTSFKETTYKCAWTIKNLQFSRRFAVMLEWLRFFCAMILSSEIWTSRKATSCSVMTMMMIMMMMVIIIIITTKTFQWMLATIQFRISPVHLLCTHPHTPPPPPLLHPTTPPPPHTQI